METSGFTGSLPPRPEPEPSVPDQDSFFTSVTAPTARHAAADPGPEPAEDATQVDEGIPLVSEVDPVADESVPVAPDTVEDHEEPVSVEGSREELQHLEHEVPSVVAEAGPQESPAPVNPLGSTLPMSLSIAAEEAAQVDVSQAPPREDRSSMFDVAPAPAPAPLPADPVSTDERPVEYDYFFSGDEPRQQEEQSTQTDEPSGFSPGEFEELYGEEPTVGLADAEIAEDAYHRSSTEPALGGEEIVLTDLLITVLERGASDLHLTAGARPTLRVNGELEQLTDYPVLTPPVIQRIMYAAITQRQREHFEEELELDYAYAVPGRARFRVNLYRQRDAIGAAFRLIPFEIKRLEELGVPPQVSNFASMPRGLVLVTGPTGSGKSTTLASIIDLANRQRKDHIMTCEDPIEFLHRHQKCIVNQREVGEDTHSFNNALKHVLRQDPDIILVGEMRDLETISIALTAAETGHLVFATLHTQDAAQTIDRMIDVFPAHQQEQVRTQLAGAIQGVVCQTLCRTADGQGRVVAVEVLIATPAVRNLIREGKTHQIYSAMQAGAKHGMQTMDQHLADHFNKGRITFDVGLEKCHHVEDFNRLTGRG